MLHVTNGDCAVERIRAAGVEGEILPWRDVLHDGPVPEALSVDELAGVRAEFIASNGWGSTEEALAQFSARDGALESALARGERIVLWFEHDLYDQLQLIQVLDRVPECDLVCEAEYLGEVSAERARELFEARRPVAAEQFALARAAWAAFRSPDPTAVERVVDAGTAPHPFLGPALTRLLEEYPSVENGLSRLERQTLQAIAAGRSTVRDAFPAAHSEVEDPIFLGDASFVTSLERLARPAVALVSLSGDGDALDREVALTPLGRAVLDGREDWVALGGVDRWVGGVHLDAADRWRWNGASGRLEARL